MRNSSITFIFITIYMCMIQGANSSRHTCDKNRYTNGCSIPLGLPAPFKNLFRPACNRHDLCYYCRHRPQYGNLTKVTCDETFEDDMMDICRQKTFLLRKTCLLAARVYYLVVSNIYNGPLTSDGWCDNRWVSQCLPIPPEITNNITESSTIVISR